MSGPYRTSAPYVVGTGINTEREGEWNARKHGVPQRRLWRKIHSGIDEETLEIRAVEVTTSRIGDAPMLPDLLNQIPAREDLGSVTADGAFDTRKWAARNEAVRSLKDLGRALGVT